MRLYEESLQLKFTIMVIVQGYHVPGPGGATLILSVGVASIDATQSAEERWERWQSLHADVSRMRVQQAP
jgi:hypothetical protein